MAERIGIGRLGREPRPEHDAVVGRIARGDTEREGIVAESRRCEDFVSGQQREREAHADAAPGVFEETTAIDQ